jgi:hypothetical protein
LNEALLGAREGRGAFVFRFLDWSGVDWGSSPEKNNPAIIIADLRMPDEVILIGLRFSTTYCNYLLL